jgi:hypothetical protein
MQFWTATEFIFAHSCIARWIGQAFFLALEMIAVQSSS